MDRGDQMALSGSASYYMQRGMPGSGTQQPDLHNSPSMRPLSNPNLPFQQTIGGSTIGSTMPLESSGMSSQCVNVGAPAGAPSGEPVKRKRGELMSGTAGMGFTPHIITVAVGEDIATKVMAFSQQGPRAICIMAATGAVSTVTLRQPSTSGGTVTYEGRFEILCLSGSYLLTDSGGSRNRSGGLSVSLASPDGRVIGGGVGGVLVAASTVQVVVGSFIWGGSKAKKQKKEGSSEGAEVAMEPDHQTVHNISPNQNLTPTSSLSPWPSSRPMDMRHSHIDIDLMRG
ncbi:hypothetical protein AHAS_Ahas02G0004600 [Arachis hypogaea]